MKRRHGWPLVVLLACFDGTADGPIRREGAASPLPAKETLERQEKRVETLRASKGSGDPETLVASALLIRLRTSRGDVAGGARLFDELLGLDLRRSPVLVHGTPPIGIARELGGLGELAAARELLANAVRRITPAFPDDDVFVLDAERALARLEVALELPHAVARLQEIEARWAAIAAGSAGAPADPSQRLLDSARQNDDRVEPSDPAFWRGPEGDAGSLDAADHEHFDAIVEISPDAAFETAERFRATLGPLEDLSLLTRVRRFRNTAQQSPAPPRADEVLEPGSREAPPAASAELAALRVALHAVSRALDRIPETDPRFETLSAELARLQRLRTAHLNDAWDFVEEVYIPVTRSEFQKRLDPGTVLLYYMVAADHTDLLVLGGEGAATHHRIAAGREELQERISYLHKEITASGRCRGQVLGGAPRPQAEGENRAGTARWLFDALLAPAEREIDAAARVLIVGDEALHRLPFVALQRQLDDGGVQAVLEWKPIHFAPSAATYATLHDSRPLSGTHAGVLVAFGDPAYERVDSGAARRPLPFAIRAAASRGHSGRLEPLPGSRREVEQIGRLFRERGREARVLLGRAAEEGAAKGARNAQFLHFAVHGIVDTIQPEHSFLALSVPEAVREGTEDGVLQGWEIEDEMRLEAELVTLSACHTAAGRQRGGEGPVSLSRSFLAAGARSVVATLWPIGDTATTDLMVRFYGHLLHGRPKDEALRLAQLELLRSAECERRTPYAWAGFQLTGDWR